MAIIEFLKAHKIQFFFSLLCLVFYGSFAYDLERFDFIKLITLYAALFYLAYLLIEKWKLPFSWLLSFGILLRLVFIVAIPNLSQDFYRFIWDGRLLAQGINPYLFTPDMYLSGEISSKIIIPQAAELYKGMGALSTGHFSNYPPINQLFFGIAGLFSKSSILGSVIILRLISMLADLGILFFGRKLLKNLNLNPNKIFWYFLSPFVIIEMTGNLHFESVMLFFLIWSIYLFQKGKWIWAAVFLGVSVSVKLLPLLLLPLFIGYRFKDRYSNVKSRFNISTSLNNCRLSMTNIFGFYLITIITVLATFLPFLSSGFISNFSTTIGLWFQNFEFNASVYYVIRWIGYQIVGWNIIATVGKILPIITLLLILGLAFFRKNRDTKQLITAMLFAVSFYFLLSTTVHPWYIATPLLLCVFTKYRFPIVWSFVVFFSYSAYGKDGFQENIWLIALEYSIVIGFAFWEIRKNLPQKEAGLSKIS